MKFLEKKASTSHRFKIFIGDATVSTGAGKTGLTNSDVTAYYIKDGDSSATSISVVSGTVGTFSSGGFKEISSANMPGCYEFCPPDACFTSANHVLIMLKGTNLVPVLIEVQLVDFDPYDAVHLGLTCLPNTAVTTNGSLVTSGAGTAQISLTSGKVTPNIDITDQIETGITLKQALRAIAAACAGASSGGPGSPVYKGLDGTTTRIAGTSDSGGNRSGITYNL